MGWAAPEWHSMQSTSSLTLAMLLRAADRLRDEALVELGVRLEDKPDGSSVWKADDPAVLRAEIEERRRTAAEARLRKLRSALESKRKVGEGGKRWGDAVGRGRGGGQL